MSTAQGPFDVLRLLIAALEELGIRYSIGGSMASSFAGEPRSTLDIDVVVELSAGHVDRLVALLSRDFYVETPALRRAVESRTSATAIHVATSIKVDLFVAGGTALDDSLLTRRQRVVAGEPPQELFVHTPEDILLQKLRWFRRGGERSDRQWRDILGIMRVQRGKLDARYLSAGATTLGVEDLLARARQEAS